MSNSLYTLILALAACGVSFALGLVSEKLRSLSRLRELEEAELDYMLNLHNEEAGK